MKRDADWLERALVYHPDYIGVCVDEEQYHAALEKLELPRDRWPAFVRGSADASVHSFENNKTGTTLHLVCFRFTRKHTLADRINAFAHEATHIWQYAEQALGEKNTSPEFEAYSVGNLAARLFESYEKQMKERRKAKCSRTRPARRAKSS